MKKLIFLLTLMLTLGGFPILGNKHHSHDNSYYPKKYHHNKSIEIYHLEKKLDLTEDQLIKIEQLTKTYQLRNLDFLKKISPIGYDIEKETLDEKPDYDKIKTLMKEKSDIYIDMRLAHMKYKQGIKELLNDKQKRQYEQMIKQKYNRKSHMYKDKKKKWYRFFK